MKRREVLASLLLAAGAPPAWAQQPGRMYRIAIFHPTTPVSALTEHSGGAWWRALFVELRRLGYEEGRNLTVERYTGAGQRETYSRLASQIEATRPDLVLEIAWGRTSAEAAAGRVPIVAFTGDPIAAGVTTSLSRPSANVTGITGDVGLPEVIGKSFELVRELHPGLSHVAILEPHSFWKSDFWSPYRRMAEEAGLRLTCLCVASPLQESAYRQVFADLDRDRPEVILVVSGPENYTFRELIVGLVNTARIPALYPFREYVQLGGLISYGLDLPEMGRHAAHQMDMILRGRPVSEVPWYRPTKWEIVVNLKTAKTLGLTIPPAILARTDEVIE